jgi:hypothetical protein
MEGIHEKFYSECFVLGGDLNPELAREYIRLSYYDYCLLGNSVMQINSQTFQILVCPAY